MRQARLVDGREAGRQLARDLDAAVVIDAPVIVDGAELPARDEMRGEIQEAFVGQADVDQSGDARVIDARERRLEPRISRKHFVHIVAAAEDLERDDAAAVDGLRQIRRAAPALGDRRDDVIGARVGLGGQRRGEQTFRTQIERRRSGGGEVGAALWAVHRHDLEARRAARYTLTAFSRYSISASTSPGSETVSAISSTSASRNCRRSRWTATRTAPSLISSVFETSAYGTSALSPVRKPLSASKSADLPAASCSARKRASARSSSSSAQRRSNSFSGVRSSRGSSR